MPNNSDQEQEAVVFVVVLFIGDIVGEPGRRSITNNVHRVSEQYHVDIVIGNAENVAGGFGLTADLANDLFDLGFSALTTGQSRLG